MQLFDRNTALLWQVADARCVLTRREGQRGPFEIAVFYGDVLVRQAVFTDHEIAADYAIDELHAVEASC
ncbi:MAG: hypothetical protein ACRD2I_11420 [Vicinamibacterales bacterium]